MSDIAPIRPLDEAAALEWLDRQPGRRMNLPAAEARPTVGMAATARQPVPESLANGGASSPGRSNVITVADSAPKARYRRGRVRTCARTYLRLPWPVRPLSFRSMAWWFCSQAGRWLWS